MSIDAVLSLITNPAIQKDLVMLSKVRSVRLSLVRLIYKGMTGKVRLIDYVWLGKDTSISEE